MIYDYKPLPAVVYEFDPKDLEEEVPVVEAEQPKSPRTQLNEENKVHGNYNLKLCWSFTDNERVKQEEPQKKEQEEKEVKDKEEQKIDEEKRVREEYIIRLAQEEEKRLWSLHKMINWLL